MAMSDPIADMLARIRNALRANHASVEAPASRMKEDICRVLKQEGYIGEYEVVEDNKQNVLKITLKYTPSGQPVLKGVQRVSKPSLRVRVKSSEIKPVCNGLGIAIISTSSGVMTGKQARQSRVGGEVLCEVW